jgi:hypothetical protein
MPQQRDTFTVHFYLKPHLADFARHLMGSDAFDIALTNPIGCMALTALTPKPKYAILHGPEFAQQRRRITGCIGVQNAKRYGHLVANLSIFETLVEHLFYHTMLVYVDGRIAAGSTQNNAIREFLEQHHVDLATIDIMSVKKTITRRRKRITINSTGGKMFRTSVPFGQKPKNAA